MRMVRCYECGKQYDYDDDGFCPRCGSFNQPARTGPAGGVRLADSDAPPETAERRKSALQRELGASLKQAERAVDRMFRSAPPSRGRRLPGGDR